MCLVQRPPRTQSGRRSCEHRRLRSRIHWQQTAWSQLRQLPTAVTRYPLPYSSSRAAAAVTATNANRSPTDAAITAFLKDMGLTVDDLKARPGLAKEIVGTHLILGANVRQQEIFDGGRSVRIAKSAAGRGNELVFTKTPKGDRKSVV